MLTLLNAVEKGEKLLIVLLILGSVLLSAVGVFYRYVLDSSLAFVEEVAGYILLAVVLLGSSVAIRSRDHIRVELVPQMIPALRRSANVLAWTTMLLVSLVMCWLSARFALRVLDQGQYSNTLMGLQIGYPLLSLPIGYGLCSLKAALVLVDEIMGNEEYIRPSLAEEEMGDALPQGTKPEVTH